jgi:DNA-binding transcriptional LysR family regulator
MADIDLNLLIALDALLAEGTVAGAARRLGLSASATSRTLARLRAATGDPLLVRAGRGMVPTPHATELHERVRDLELAPDRRGDTQISGDGVRLILLAAVKLGFSCFHRQYVGNSLSYQAVVLAN